VIWADRGPLAVRREREPPAAAVSGRGLQVDHAHITARLPKRYFENDIEAAEAAARPKSSHS